MIPKALKNYGGPKADAAPVEDPTTQLPSSEYNSLAEDCAQLTRTPARAIVSFMTGTATPAVMRALSVWGAGVLQQPTIARVASGHYTVTYPSSFIDANAVTEAVNFTFGFATIDATIQGHARVSGIAANVVNVWILDNSWGPSDLGGVGVTVWMF